MNNYVLSFKDIDKTNIMMVGGKGANLGELAQIGDICVPDGFCVTTEAYKEIIAQIPTFESHMAELSKLKSDDAERIRNISATIRAEIETTKIPSSISQAVTQLLQSMGSETPYAIRSSATAEDLPTASFAGQQDTYLNIFGENSILEHIRKCWASLFTERAVIYRTQNGFDHKKVHLSVVVQKMVFPDAAGIMFTADPVSSNRKIISIDAGFGLGEALVSGLVDADIYKVQESKIIDKKVSSKKLAIYALKEGGVEERHLTADKQDEQTLTYEQILNLAEIGRKIESYFGSPQDIEWCLSDGKFYIVQSRPITTLYPIPKAKDDKNRIYMSLGHQQMMTDCVSPLGISFFGMFLRHTVSMPVCAAGGRMYLDASADMASPMSRKVFTQKGFGSANSDALIQKALMNISDRKDFMKGLAKDKASTGFVGSIGGLLKLPWQALRLYRANDAEQIPNIIKRMNQRIEDTEQRMSGLFGAELLDFIERDMSECYRNLVSENYGLGALGVFIPIKIDKNLKKWLGEEKVSDFISQSIVCNVTTEMGLAMLDVADVIRNYPAVIEYLKTAKDEDLFEKLQELDGGKQAAEALNEYLLQYGARCSGEIDIARSRWIENPTSIISTILNNVDNFEPGARNKIVEEKRHAVDTKVEELLSRLQKMPGGSSKAKKTAKQISIMRNYQGFREYPKFAIMQHFFEYKKALLREAKLLIQKGIIYEPGDIFYLYFDELREVFLTGSLDYSIISERKADYEMYEKLTPPRVITSEGEIIAGEYDIGDAPEDALVGVAVSSGIIEGRARVALKPDDARMEKGDILVTTFTDPSWTAAFVSISGLVTEVGGMMTHGAIVAREYGIPAVVSVENATKLIKDGQRIRINGIKGYVEILE